MKMTLFLYLSKSYECVKNEKNKLNELKLIDIEDFKIYR